MTAQPVGSVKSADGTAISYIRTGNGPPLVMVPSVSADHSTFGSVAPLLAEHFTLYMIDREDAERAAMRPTGRSSASTRTSSQ